MTRVKAIYRSWGIPCSSTQVYSAHHRAEWLAKIHEPGVRRRAMHYYQQLDALRSLRLEVRKDLLALFPSTAISSLAGSVGAVDAAGPNEFPTS
jgi:hypothetical protein